MAEAQLPISITYDTMETTPIGDVIAALQATDSAIQDAVSLLPSLIDGVEVSSSRVNVRLLTQESPLREMFIVSLIVAFQEDLKSEIPTMIEDLFKVEVSDSYDSILTALIMVVLFYGVGLIKDFTTKGLEDSQIKRQMNEIIDHLAVTTNKDSDEIKKILDAKFSRPSTVKKLAKTVSGFFIPAQRKGAKAVTFDRKRIDPEFIKEIPYPEEYNDREDFQRFESYSNVTLEVHAQDKDKQASGWAAIPKGIHDSRLRMKLIDPVTVNDIWNRNYVNGDIIIISKLGSNGYIPSEIHLTNIC